MLTTGDGSKDAQWARHDNFLRSLAQKLEALRQATGEENELDDSPKLQPNVMVCTNNSANRNVPLLTISFASEHINNTIKVLLNVKDASAKQTTSNNMCSSSTCPNDPSHSRCTLGAASGTIKVVHTSLQSRFVRFFRVYIRLHEETPWINSAR